MKWIGNVERMGSDKFVKVYESELKGPSSRGRPLGRWKDRVEEYLGQRGMNGRGVLEQARRECWDMERWRLLPWPPPKGTLSEGPCVRAILDRQKIMMRELYQWEVT